MGKVKFNGKDFAAAALWSAIWIGISELARYFLLVRPYFMDYLSVIPNMGEMTQPVTLVGWTVFSVLMIVMFTFMFWLCAVAFSNNSKAIIISAVASWTFLLVMFWIALATMHLSEWSMLPKVLPFALLETLVASYICSRVYAKRGLK